jgi:Uncharacterized protein conserved in bacteria
MSAYRLIVIAGPNGAGKSESARKLLDSISLEDVTSFDFDKRKWDYYNADFDHQLREEMAHNRAAEDFKKESEAALESKTNFCYETNFFESDPTYWPKRFKEQGFEIELYFFCLDQLQLSIARVAERVNTKGHFIPVEQIKERYKGSLSNVNQYYKVFDRFMLLNSSVEEIDPIIEIYNGQIIGKKAVIEPNIKSLFPTIL